MHYPFLGRYDNYSDDEIVRWQFRCMKNAGIDAVCASNLAHSSNPGYIGRLMGIARDLGIGVYVLDENAGGELGEAADQDSLNQAVDEIIQRCNDTMIAYATGDAYFKIDGRPVYFLPFWVPGFGAPGIEQVTIQQNALRRFHDGVTVDGRRPWLYSTSVYLANFSGNLSFDLGQNPGPTVHLNQGWLDTGFESFTCWDPLGIQEQYNRDDIGQSVLESNLSEAFSRYIENHTDFGATPIVPIQVAFDRRNNEGPGAGGLAPVDPKFVTPHDPAFWKSQIQVAIASGAPQIWIAQFNEWHEDQMLEPGWGFRDEAGNEDPFAFLRILAEETGGSFEEPPLPPESSVDTVIWEEVSTFELPPTATPSPTNTPVPPSPTPTPTATASPSPTATFARIDLNRDRTIDALDLFWFQQEWE